MLGALYDDGLQYDLADPVLLVSPSPRAVRRSGGAKCAHRQQFHVTVAELCVQVAPELVVAVAQLASRSGDQDEHA